MGLISKLKDALFEEEYVEVEEKPKKEKKVKPKKVDEKLEKSSKPIAKKVVLPGKREERIEEIEEEELRDEDFEIRPKDDIIKEEVMEALDEDQEPVLKPQTPEFLMMDDDDFKVEEEVYVPHDDGLVRASKEEEKEEVREPYLDHYKEDIYSYYQSARPKERESMPYGIRNDDIRVHEYGGYEKKEEKTGFRPSPIISPIYGILDKNYKKEDVVQKREVRLTSSYARGNVSIEDVRKKAYGSLSDDIEREIDEKEEIKEKPEIVEEIEEPENILVDLSEEQDKPFVKDVTMGDALEYYSDLGLEYNVDYMDASKEKAAPKKVKEEVEEKTEELNEVQEEIKDEVVEEKEIVEEPKIVEEIKEVKEEKTEEDSEADDNLFDLIDSMYQEED